MAGFMDALFLVYERWARDVPPFPAYLGPFTDPECQFIGADGEGEAITPWACFGCSCLAPPNTRQVSFA